MSDTGTKVPPSESSLITNIYTAATIKLMVTLKNIKDHFNLLVVVLGTLSIVNSHNSTESDYFAIAATGEAFLHTVVVIESWRPRPRFFGVAAQRIQLRHLG